MKSEATPPLVEKDRSFSRRFRSILATGATGVDVLRDSLPLVDCAHGL